MRASYLAIVSFYRPQLQQQEVLQVLKALSHTLDAGISITKSLEILKIGEKKAVKAKFISQILKYILTGNSLVESLQKNTNKLSNHQLAAIKVAEKTNSLPTVLTQICQDAEKKRLLKKRVKKALIYPTFVISICLLVAWALIAFAIPQLSSMFINANVELPTITKLIVTVSQLSSEYWLAGLIIFVIIAILIVMSVTYLKHSYFTNGLCYLFLHIPILGEAIRYSFIISYARYLVLTLNSGMSLLASLQLAKENYSNPYFKSLTAYIASQVEAGNSLYSAMSKYKILPEYLIQMVKVGETTSSLSLILNKLSEQYSIDLDYLIETRLAIFEYIVIIVLGIFVAVFVVGIYLPMFSVGLSGLH